MHVSVNIQSNVEKDTTLWLFVFSSPKLPVAMRFSSVAFGLPYLLIELFYIGVPLVWTVGRTYGHVTSKISRMHRLPNFLTHGAPLRAHRARESSSKKKLQNIGVVKAKKTHRQQYSLNDDGKYPKFWVMSGAPGHVFKWRHRIPIPELAGRGSHFLPIPHNGIGKREDRGDKVFIQAYS